ncbi:DNA adenine methylase [Leptolyngbya sp. FACHB-17]|uniref:DNA adenine methylase n=1 Tax=unclassified Leptolyngbya TaxID=2650499 RepID=UPI0016806BE3|nr:DNA adenine methylase [Leptolyngbya sp. FACHB-17]MBD2081490.1 DNA adenine methylase [Leptolyngbya sp. FACHB-17]
MITQVQSPGLPRPFIKWAGGKNQLISQYVSYFPKRYQNYYEPFVGGGAIFFHLQPATSLLIDINLELVNVYRCVRDQVEELINRLEQHHQQHCPEHYYQVRAQIAASDDWFYAGNNVDRAARLIYLNKTCFNGLYRENSKGHFNVPIGSYKKPGIYDPEVLRADSIALSTAEIKPGSFDQVLQSAHSSNDFVYFDPPYYPISSTSNFTAYNRYSFSEDQQVQLRDVVTELSDRGVKVMLSNSDCSFIRELYKEFNIHTIYATRNINCNAEKRGKITEVLVTNY